MEEDRTPEDLYNIVRLAIDNEFFDRITDDFVDYEALEIGRKMLKDMGYNPQHIPSISLYSDLVDSYERARLAIERYDNENVLEDIDNEEDKNQQP